MSCDTFIKAAGSTRRITGDWSTFMGAGVSIASVAYTIPSGISGGSAAFTSTTETNWYSGGVEGQEYEVVITITTDESPARVEAHSIYIQVEKNC